jgi:hypothetical protein
MKKFKLVILVITILSVFTTFNVNAAKTATLKGHVVYEKHGNGGITRADGVDYEYFFYTFVSDSGGTYRAYCTNPDLAGRAAFHLSCRAVSSKNYATVYYLGTKYKTRSPELDLALRAAGMMDRDYEAQLDRDCINLPTHEERVKCLGETNVSGTDAAGHVNVNGLKWWRAFQYTAGYYRILYGSTPGDPSQYLVAHETMGLRGEPVEPAMRMLAEAETEGWNIKKDSSFDSKIKSQVYKAGDVGEGGASGQNVQLVPISMTETQKTYQILPVAGKVIEDISIAPSGSISASAKWDRAAQSGVLVVNVSGSSTSCDGSVVISAVTSEGTGNTTDTIGDNPQLYVCSNDVSSRQTQNFIVFGPDLQGDEFTFSGDCACETCGNVPGPGELKENDVNNCCEDDASSILAQYGMDDLFCFDDKVKVQYFKLKCGTENYLEGKIVDEICEWYCSKTAEYTLPGATATKSGRYFKLNKSRDGVAGPVLAQYKRCRTLIHWDVWYTRYKEQVENQIAAYNEEQHQVAQLLTFSDAVSNKKTYNPNLNVTCTATGTESYTYTCTGYRYEGSEKVSYETTCDGTASLSGSSQGSISSHPIDEYDEIPYAKNHPYNELEIDLDGHGNSKETTYTSITAKYRSTKIPTSTVWHNLKQTQDYQSDYNAKANEIAPNAESACRNSASHGGSVSGCSATCTQPSNPGNQVDPDAKKSEINGLINAQVSKFNSAAGQALTLEQNLTKCDTYGQENINITSEPEMDFKYTQAYINDYGKPQTDVLGINFSKSCVKTKMHGYSEDGPTGLRGGGEDRFSTIYQQSPDVTQDFAAGTLPTTSLDTIGNGYKSHLSEKYQAQKQFTTDDVIRMDCKWDDDENNTLYTLVPSGVVQDVSTANYTKHNREYFTVRTHLEGKFQTYFTLSNVMEGFFDQYIDQGTTCAGETGNATCTFIIDDEITSTGECNTTVTANDDICSSPKCEWNDSLSCGQVKTLFEYKEVDPSDVFPNESQYTGKLAYNWLADSDGIAYRKAMEANAQHTYDPTTSLTYSFTLTPSDLKAIRAYNKSRLSVGGFTDFNMDCAGVGSDGVVTRCYSKFLTAISNGNSLSYNGGTLSLNTSNVDINSVRNRLEWK